MSPENNSVSLVHRFAVMEQNQMPQGYFRSRLYVSTDNSSPLIAAAGPLFSLMERLSISPSLPAIDSIRGNIEHELLAFQSRLQSQHCSEDMARIAQYLIAATMDELLGKNYLRVSGNPAEFKAFTPSSLDEHGPEKRFFDIVYYLRERSSQYLDLLELAYYCLIAGFEGEQHFRSDGRQILDSLIDDLYQRIQSQRVHKPHQLFEERSHSQAIPKSQKPLWATAGAAVVLLGLTFFASRFMLEHKAKTLLLEHTVFAKLDR